MSNSELILNEDGSIYHLALKPDEVSDTIITVGDQDRVVKISQHFDEIEFTRSRREFVTHTGRIGSKRISVISTGIGTDNVDIVLNELHALRELRVKDAHKEVPFNIIRLGTSGAVREEMPLDTILISEAAIGLDALLHFYPWQNYLEEIAALVKTDEGWKALPKPYAAFAGKELMRKFEAMADLTGVTITTPGFYAPQGRSVNLPARVPDFIRMLSNSSFAGKPITNIEMETAGIYGLSTLLGHQAVSISAILANRATGAFSKQPDKIMEKMILKALEVVERL